MGVRWRQGRARRKTFRFHKREVIEELGVEIEVTGSQEPIGHSYDHAKIRLLPYLCKLANNSDEPEESDQHIDNYLIYLNGLKILVDALVIDG
jgi:hypothetical protein